MILHHLGLITLLSLKIFRIIYACLILGYKGKYNETKDRDEKIIHFCNNIATSLKPVYKIEEELAFNKAYKTGLKENIWQNL